MTDPTQALTAATQELTAGVRELQSLVNRISSDVGRLVALYNPAVFKRFELAANDLTASIGRALLPVLERFRVLIRGIGDSIASLTPAGRAMIAGLTAAGVGMVSLTAATVAFSVAVNTALGGLPIILGAIAGGAVGVAFALKDLEEVQKAVHKIMEAGTIVLNTLGSVMGQVFAAVSPLIDLFADLARRVSQQLAQTFQQLGPTLQKVSAIVAKLVEQLANVGAANFQTMLGLFQSLAGVLLPLVQPLATIIGTLSQFGGVITQIFGSTLGLALALLTPALTGLGAVLEVLTTPINLLSQLFNSVAGVVNSVLMPVFRLMADFFSGPFRVMGAIWQAVMSPFVAGMNAISDALGDLGAAFSEVFALINEVAIDLGKAVVEVFNDLRGLIPDVANPLRVMAEAIRWLSRQVREFVAMVRGFLGLPDPNTFQKDRSQGMAVRNVGSTTVEDDIRAAQLSSLASGRVDDPATTTANNSVIMAKALEEIRGMMQKWEPWIEGIKNIGNTAQQVVNAPSDVAEWAIRSATRAIGGK